MPRWEVSVVSGWAGELVGRSVGGIGNHVLMNSGSYEKAEQKKTRPEKSVEERLSRFSLSADFFRPRVRKKKSLSLPLPPFP